MANITGEINAGSLVGTVSSPRRLNGNAQPWAKSEIYTGEYEVTPSTTDNTVLETKNKTLIDNVIVYKIPYESVSNPQGGNTITIGGY